MQKVKKKNYSFKSMEKYKISISNHSSTNSNVIVKNLYTLTCTSIAFEDCVEYVIMDSTHRLLIVECQNRRGAYCIDLRSLQKQYCLERFFKVANAKFRIFMGCHKNWVCVKTFYALSLVHLSSGKHIHLSNVSAGYRKLYAISPSARYHIYTVYHHEYITIYIFTVDFDTCQSRCVLKNMHLDNFHNVSCVKPYMRKDSVFVLYKSNGDVFLYWDVETNVEYIPSLDNHIKLSVFTSSDMNKLLVSYLPENQCVYNLVS
jgi:hypothetical protein